MDVFSTERAKELFKVIHKATLPRDRAYAEIGLLKEIREFYGQQITELEKQVEFLRRDILLLAEGGGVIMKEGNNPNVEPIVICITNSGMFLVGRKSPGSKKLLNPRVFAYLDNGNRIQMSPLPSTPPFITLIGNEIVYPVPEDDQEGSRDIINLYNRVTDPVQIAKAKEENRLREQAMAQAREEGVATGRIVPINN